METCTIHHMSMITNWLEFSSNIFYLGILVSNVLVAVSLFVTKDLFVFKIVLLFVWFVYKHLLTKRFSVSPYRKCKCKHNDLDRV